MFIAHTRIAARLLLCSSLSFLPTSLSAKATVGMFIGSYDPGTIAHALAVRSQIDDFQLDHMYVLVNYNTDKDYNASVEERVEMMRLQLADLGDRVTVLREPVEGRLEFASYLLRKHQGKVLGIFGEDTFDKNFKTFTTEGDLEDFDYIKIARPVHSAEAVPQYIPIIHPADIDADEVSSSKVRELIAAGMDPVAAGVLAPQVWLFAKTRRLYFSPPASAFAKLQHDFEQRFAQWVEATLLHKFSPLFPANIAPPVFKPGQSLEAEKDKFLRHVIKSANLDRTQELAFRTAVEPSLYGRIQTKPLRLRERAAIYYGSFDFMTADQLAVVGAALRREDIDVVYVAPLASSRKPLQHTMAERLQFATQALESFGANVRVLPGPGINDADTFVKVLANEHQSPTTVILGANVFRVNLARLHGIPQIKFAVVPIVGYPISPATLPVNAEILDPDSSPDCNAALK